MYMKANQNFRASEEAVSPVIGVILMVAITVVLAAVVFVLVTKLSSNQSDKAPDVSFVRDESADRLVVNSADAGLTYCEFSLAVTSSGTTDLVYDLNSPAVATECALGTTATKIATSAGCTTPSTSAITAAGYIEICEETTAAGVSNVEITLVHVESNKVIATYTFGTIAFC